MDNMTAKDIATYRKYISLDESEYIDEIEKLMSKHPDDKENRQKQYAVKAVRWAKAWAMCDFNEEMVRGLIAANRLMAETIAEMLGEARIMADWRKAQLDKQYGFGQQGKSYYEEIWASVRIEELDSDTKDFLLYRPVFHPGGLTVCDCHLSISNFMATECFSNHFFGYRKRKGFTFPCKAVSVYIDFLKHLKAHNHLHIPIDNGLKSLMRLPENIGKKWKCFFAKLDRFGGELFCASMLEMIGNSLLTPEDVCAIVSYSYQISFEHHSEEWIRKMD